MVSVAVRQSVLLHNMRGREVEIEGCYAVDHNQSGTIIYGDMIKFI